MKRFSKCRISRWLVVLLITILATGNLLAGKVCTDTFATAYNEIIRGYENKGGNLGYARKGAFDIVTCEDVAFLRGLVGSLVPQYIEKIDLSKYTASEAFPPFQFNDGRGFLVVPAQYAGADYYTNDSVQFNPPVLWCHFIDMANILNKMKYKREGSIISILCSMTSSFYEYFPGEPPGLLSNDHYDGPTNNFGSFSSERKQSSLGSLNPYWCVRWDSRADTSYSLTFSLPNNLHRDSAVFYLLMNDSFSSYHACPYGDLDYYFYNSTDSWQSYANIVNNGTLNVAFAPISVDWDDPTYHEPYCSNNVNGSRASAYNTIISSYNDKVLVIPGEDECAKDGI